MLNNLKYLSNIMQILYLYALLISFFWGIIPIIYKIVLKRLNNITVMLLNGLFYFILLVFLFLYNKTVVMDDLNKITSTEYVWIFIATLFGGLIGNLLYYYILKKGEAAILTALMYTAPVVTLIAAYFILKDKITPLAITGILLIVAGVICICLK
jgi:drug/metabolite transporter (DMT)-like permease